MTPLRQFKGVPPDVIKKAEGKQFVSDLLSPCILCIDDFPSQPWYRYFDLVSILLSLTRYS